MVFFNHATRQMTAKIVYYGPGLCGKTTNLNTIYGKTSQKARGEMVSLNTETDRTLFFDLLPLDVGVVGGFKTKLQLYTVPGQVFYNSTRKLVLKGVDGIVFVADSQMPMLDANKESLQNLDDNLRELGLDIRQIPMIFQWNKRDLKNVVPIEQMEQELNPRRQPSFQSVASDGSGVFETLRGITKLALGHIKAHHFADTGKEEVPVAAPPPAPVAVVAPPEVHATPPPAPLAPPADHPEVLTLSDLPSVGELLDDEAYAPPPVLPRPQIPASAPAAPRVPPPLRPAPAPLKPVLPLASPARGLSPLKPVTPKLVTLAPPMAAKPRPLAVPGLKAPLAPVLGDMSHGGGMPSVLKLDLPSSLDGHDLEIIVQVRQSGHVVTEGMLKKSSPGVGASAKFSVELKRS